MLKAIYISSEVFFLLGFGFWFFAAACSFIYIIYYFYIIVDFLLDAPPDLGLPSAFRLVQLILVCKTAVARGRPFAICSLDSTVRGHYMRITRHNDQRTVTNSYITVSHIHTRSTALTLTRQRGASISVLVVAHMQRSYCARDM